MIKEKEALIDEIESAVSEYSCNHNDKNFNIVVSISASNGWVKAKIKEG